MSNPACPRNQIDAFVLEKLDVEGLKPSVDADPATLVRRVYLDLIGLPPSPAETAAFTADLATPATKNWSIVYCRRLRSANAGRVHGWTWPATPTPASTTNG